MKKQSIFLTLALPLAAAAQSLSPTVVASAGNHASAGNVQLCYTVGEVAVTTVSGGSSIITQGFHQPIEVTSGIAEGEIPGNIKVFPNPASHEVFVETELQSEQLTAAITDLQGRIVRELSIHQNGTHSILVDDLAAAGYQLTLYGTHKKFRKTFNIIINR